MWPNAWGHAGCGVILAALPIWAPLPLLTSCFFLSPCRLAGAWSYWCHCHRLPPGYVCACGLGCHHTEKVLGLLNSIKDFSVTQLACLQPLTAPELSALGPERNGATDMGKALVALYWAARLHPVLIALGECVYLLGDRDLAGPVNPTQNKPVTVCGFERGGQKGPPGSSLGDGNSVGHHPAQLSWGRVVHGCRPPQCATPFHPLHLDQLHWRGTVEDTSDQSGGGRRHTSLLVLACSATFYHTEKQDNKKFHSVR